MGLSPKLLIETAPKVVANLVVYSRLLTISAKRATAFIIAINANNARHHRKK
jgi:hypothetical protein